MELGVPLLSLVDDKAIIPRELAYSQDVTMSRVEAFFCNDDPLMLPRITTVTA